MPITRRRFLTRALGAAGLVTAGVAVAGMAEADRGEDAGRALFVEELGAGAPTLVFLPGIGATSRYWHTVVAPLAARARLLLVDPLGFGRSPKPWTTYSVDRHVAALHRAVALGGEGGPVTLVGHSLGARLAVAYAARYPERVGRLVLVSLPYYGGPGEAEAHLRRSGPGHWLWTNMALAAVVCLLSRRLLGWAFPRLLPELPREVAEDLTQMTWRSSTSSLWELLYRYDLGADADRLPDALPVLCLHGDGDRTAPLAGVRALVARHPQWRLEVVVGADHNLPLGRPDAVRGALAPAPW